MSCLIKQLRDKSIVSPPSFVTDNIIYEARIGSIAYGVSNDTSDNDIYAITIPPKKNVFPHLNGDIIGFGTQTEQFQQWQQHHVLCDKKSYDLTAYGIVNCFRLFISNNPNMLDFLFTPDSYVTFATRIGNIIRGNRHKFLSKKCFNKFKNYSFSQMKKIKEKKFSDSTRKENVEKHGYNTKYAYHLVRLLLECEEILMEHNLTLNRNIQILRSIRDGEWTLEQINDFFMKKEAGLEEVYSKSTLRIVPDEEAIKEILFSCLEQHYGSLEKCVHRNSNTESLIKKLDDIINEYR